MLAIFAATALLTWSGAAFAQLEAEAMPPAEMLIVIGATGQIEGKIADIEPTGTQTTMLRLEDSTRLVVLDPLPVAHVGDSVTARYVESVAGDKLVTTMRVSSEVEAP